VTRDILAGVAFSARVHIQRETEAENLRKLGTFLIEQKDWKKEGFKANHWRHAAEAFFRTKRAEF